MLWLRPPTGCTRPNACTGPTLMVGTVLTTSNSPPCRGCIGSTNTGCTATAVTSHQLNRNTTICRTHVRLLYLPQPLKAAMETQTTEPPSNPGAIHTSASNLEQTIDLGFLVRIPHRLRRPSRSPSTLANGDVASAGRFRPLLLLRTLRSEAATPVQDR